MEQLEIPPNTLAWLLTLMETPAAQIQKNVVEMMKNEMTEFAASVLFHSKRNSPTSVELLVQQRVCKVYSKVQKYLPPMENK
jgi:hypothetical protein